MLSNFFVIDILGAVNETPYQDSNDTDNASDKQSATVSIVIDNERNQEMENIVDRVQNTAAINCDNAKPSSLKLPRETAHGAAQVFEIQGRAALRLANFLSSFLQITYKSGSNGIPDFLKVDELLNEGQLFGEVMTNVLSDINMVGTGIFFDKNGFETKLDGNIVTREYFGPYAWQPEEPETVSVIDFAGFSNTYTDNAWFQNMKASWRTVDDLEEYVVDPVVNSESRGLESLPQHTYFAATYEDGEWLQPEFICNKDITINKWTVRFIVPFFGFNKQRSLEFKGIVAVDAPLQNMDINQCPADVMVSNAFKNTAKCDYNSTYCSPINGMMFQTGAYKCECRQGYHMPFNSTERYFDGQSVEEEYKKYKSGLPNRFASFKCDKIPGKDKTTTSQACPSIQISALVVTFALVVIFLTRN